RRRYTLAHGRPGALLCPVRGPGVCPGVHPGVRGERASRNGDARLPGWVPPGDPIQGHLRHIGQRRLDDRDLFRRRRLVRARSQGAQVAEGRHPPQAGDRQDRRQAGYASRSGRCRRRQVPGAARPAGRGGRWDAAGLRPHLPRRPRAGRPGEGGHAPPPPEARRRPLGVATQGEPRHQRDGGAERREGRGPRRHQGGGLLGGTDGREVRHPARRAPVGRMSPSVGGRYGLLGSGEFLPWAEPVDRWLASSGGGRGGRVLVVPTASAPEGDEVFWRWGTMGLSHYRKLGLEPAVVELKVRGAAFRPEGVAEVAGASLIFFSGGNPAYLARTLRETPFWEAVGAAVGEGCALAGSSGGIAYLGIVTFDPAAAANGAPPERLWVPALGWFKALFGPHWDAVERWRPGAHAMLLAGVPEDCAFLGIDEDTAVVGDGTHWEVRGRGTATVQPAGADPFVARAGEHFD